MKGILQLNSFTLEQNSFSQYLLLISNEVRQLTWEKLTYVFFSSLNPLERLA